MIPDHFSKASVFVQQFLLGLAHGLVKAFGELGREAVTATGVGHGDPGHYGAAGLNLINIFIFI